jgi:lysophospholipase L1-like esterase
MIMRALTGVLMALACAGTVAAAAAPPAAPRWIGSWGAPPVTPNLVPSARTPVTARFGGQTLRQVVRISAGGRQVRIRVSNEYGREPLRIGGAHIALAGEGGAIRPGTDHVLVFSEHPATTVPPGAAVLSDPVTMDVAALSSLAVSLYLPADTGLCTCHPVAVQTGYASGPGDFTGAAAFPTQSTFLYRAFLTGVEVRTAQLAAAVVVLGDSLSDGTVSTPDGNHRWPDRLAERLNASAAGQRAWGVVNEGISGNRLLADGTGQSALARFDRDVLSVPGARYLVVLLGVNDLGQAFGPAAPAGSPLIPEDLISGYRQIIARAHAHGIKVYGATITPYEGVGYWSAKGEADRQDINSWIRGGGAFDGVIDFDAVWRDPAHPARIRDGLHAPDHLHGSDAGYRALADAIDLKLFQ